MVSARQVHLPHYLCPAHASTLLSPAPSAPYGNDLLLPDLADTHGSPSAYATMASVSSVQGFMDGWSQIKSWFYFSHNKLFAIANSNGVMRREQSTSSSQPWLQCKHHYYLLPLAEKWEISHISCVLFFCSSSVKIGLSEFMCVYIKWSEYLMWFSGRVKGL